ncbi:tyrosine phosphatase family-domain-containing protein [Mycena vulgaris]|nr:tyrosine phosphatase family-domain-containing protein [Mycena vulgaris]
MSSLPILSSPPFVVVEGVINIRDLGGYTTDDASHVKPGLVFRSGEMSNISETGKLQLVALGIRRVFDLRTHLEINSYKMAVPDIPGVEFVSVPVGKEEPWGAGSMELRLKRYEENELEAFVKDARDTLVVGAPAYEAIFRQFLERPDEPCVFHCTAGKDRTGLAAALILMFLGVGDAEITKDYALTVVGLEPARATLAARLQNIPVYRENWKGSHKLGERKRRFDVCNTRHDTRGVWWYRRVFDGVHELAGEGPGHYSKQFAHQGLINYNFN